MRFGVVGLISLCAALIGPLVAVGAEDPAAPPKPPASLDPAVVAELGFTRMLVVRRRAMCASHVYTYHSDGQWNGGGLYVHDLVAGTLTRLVDASDGQILDCALSFDGREVLFSMRRGPDQPRDKTYGWLLAGDPYYQIYRIGVDGTGLTRLTKGQAHHFNPVWLPDGDIALLSTRPPRGSYCFLNRTAILHRMDRDGAGLRAISGNYHCELTPSLGQDGGLLYTRWEYVDKSEFAHHAIWSMRPDGAAAALVFGQQTTRKNALMAMRELPDGSRRLLGILACHGGGSQGGQGAVVLIDPQAGTEGLDSVRNLALDAKLNWTGSTKGPYATPMPLDGERYLVSRAGSIELHSLCDDRATMLLAAEPWPGRRVGVGWASTTDGMSWYYPTPLRPRPAPPVLASSTAGDPQPTTCPAADAPPTARALVVDVHHGLTPTVPAGTVRTLCVVEELPKLTPAGPDGSYATTRKAFGNQGPVVSAGGTYAPKVVWGFAPVAADGSAFLEVPAGRSIYFLALDAQGRCVQRMRSFIHPIPGETLGCIGCHEPRSAAPPVAAARPAALCDPPVALTRPTWAGQPFSYRSVVQSVLDRNCVRCHNARAHPKGIDLSGDFTDYFCVSYDTLTRGAAANMVHFARTIPGKETEDYHRPPPVNALGTARSPLVDLILAGHPDADGKPRASLSDDDRCRLFTWIDLNVPYYDTTLSRHPRSLGGRRLYPRQLDAVLAEVSARRCAGCHQAPPGDDRKRKRRKTQLHCPRQPWTRILDPAANPFLLAPLAVEAGGTGACGETVFSSTDDPDYRRIVDTFTEIAELAAKRPRHDMDADSPEATRHGRKETEP